MKMLPFLTLGWVVLTFITGRAGIPFSHSAWAAASVIPAILVQLFWIRKSKDKKLIPLTYAAIIGLVVTSLFGLGVLMGIFPPLFHQLIVWIVGPYIVFVGFKQLSSH